MSHLGERISALVDGELGHAERERALAHLTFCAACRREVEEMRSLKARLRAMEPPAMPADLTMSLLRMAEPGGPIPPRVRPLGPPPGGYGTGPADNRPRRGRAATGPGREGRSRRAGYVAVGVASAAVALGTLFLVNSVDSRPTLPVDMFVNRSTSTPSPSLHPPATP